MGTIVIATVVSLWFAHRRGLAISLAFTGASFGGVVVVPLLVVLVEQIGFRAAMLSATAIMVVVLAPVLFAWIDRPSRAQPVERQSDGSLQSTRWLCTQSARRAARSCAIGVLDDLDSVRARIAGSGRLYRASDTIA